jgi:PTS system mannitol-specific IIA component
MRLIDYFPASSISVRDLAGSWQQAIDYSMEPLLKNGYIDEKYIQAIKDSTLNNGPYYILAPGVAMPHARPECGALKTGLSLTLLKSPVVFDQGNQPVSLLIGLSATDSTSHIDAIQALSELLCEDENIASLLAATSEKQLAEILARA